jgi:hypothetical protein
MVSKLSMVLVGSVGSGGDIATAAVEREEKNNQEFERGLDGARVIQNFLE